MDSKKEGEKLLAVLVCEKLAKEKIMVLSAENIERIKLIYKSKEKITVCAGCTHFKKSTTTEILKTPNFVHLFFERWIRNYL